MTKLDDAVAREAGIALAAARLARRQARIQFWRAFRRELVGAAVTTLAALPLVATVSLLTHGLHAWWPAIPGASLTDAAYVVTAAIGVVAAVAALRRVATASLSRAGTGPRPIAPARKLDGSH